MFYQIHTQECNRVSMLLYLTLAVRTQTEQFTGNIIPA